MKLVNLILDGKLKHASRFSIVGISNTLIDFTVFTIFYEVTGLGYIVSQIAGYCFGVLNSYILNKKWTFNDTQKSKKNFNEPLKFIIINLNSLLITVVLMNFFIGDLHLNVYISKIAIIITTQFVNFFGYKLWVFN